MLFEDGDGPTEMKRKFWALMGPGLDTALLSDGDRLTLTSRCKLSVYDELAKYPEANWDGCQVACEYTDRNGNPFIIKHLLMEQALNQLVDKVVMVKGTRGREGFFLTHLTTSHTKSDVKQISEQTARTEAQPKEKKGFWGFMKK